MFRFLARVIGLVLIAAALVTLVADAGQTISASQWVYKPLGQYWFDVSPGSLNASQAAVQRYVSPLVWDAVIQPLLTWPAWATFAPLGVFLLWRGERRPRRRRRF